MDHVSVSYGERRGVFALLDVFRLHLEGTVDAHLRERARELLFVDVGRRFFLPCDAATASGWARSCLCTLAGAGVAKDVAVAACKELLTAPEKDGVVTNFVSGLIHLVLQCTASTLLSVELTLPSAILTTGKTTSVAPSADPTSSYPTVASSSAGIPTVAVTPMPPTTPITS